MAPATSKLLATMKAANPSVPVQFRISLNPWKLIDRVALRLEITVGVYRLGCGGYAAWVGKQERKPLPEGLSLQFTPGN